MGRKIANDFFPPLELPRGDDAKRRGDRKGALDLSR